MSSSSHKYLTDKKIQLYNGRPSSSKSSMISGSHNGNKRKNQISGKTQIVFVTDPYNPRMSKEYRQVLSNFSILDSVVTLTNLDNGLIKMRIYVNIPDMKSNLFKTTMKLVENIRYYPVTYTLEINEGLVNPDLVSGLNEIIKGYLQKHFCLNISNVDIVQKTSLLKTTLDKQQEKEIVSLINYIPMTNNGKTQVFINRYSHISLDNKKLKELYGYRLLSNSPLYLRVLSLMSLDEEIDTTEFLVFDDCLLMKNSRFFNDTLENFDNILNKITTDTFVLDVPHFKMNTSSEIKDMRTELIYAEIAKLWKASPVYLNFRIEGISMATLVKEQKYVSKSIYKSSVEFYPGPKQWFRTSVNNIIQGGLPKFRFNANVDTLKRIEFHLEFSRRKESIIKLQYASYRSYVELIKNNSVLLEFFPNIKVLGDMNIEANFTEYQEITKIKNIIRNQYEGHKKWTIYPSNDLYHALEQRIFLTRKYSDIIPLAVSITNYPDAQKELYVVLPITETVSMPSLFTNSNQTKAIDISDLSNDKVIGTLKSINTALRQLLSRQSSTINIKDERQVLIMRRENKIMTGELIKTHGNFSEWGLMGLYKMGLLPGLVEYPFDQHKVMIPKITKSIVKPPGKILALSIGGAFRGRKISNKQIDHTYFDDFLSVYGNSYSIEIYFKKNDFLIPLLFSGQSHETSKGSSDDGITKSLFTISLSNPKIIKEFTSAMKKLWNSDYFLSPWSKVLLIKTGKLSHQTFSVPKFISQESESNINGPKVIEFMKFLSEES